MLNENGDGNKSV